jgi:high affinity sulfate transporter 1
MSQTASPTPEAPKEDGPAGGGPLGSLFGSIRPYQRSWLSQDVVAGITLAALAIPEVMGYTKIAGTPVITGLYTILLPIVAFGLFASSRHLVVGGDSATAAIMYAGIAGLGIAGLKPDTPQWVSLASLSALIAAAFLLLARLAKLGFLANFISRTVLIGFLTGVGIQVALGQVAGLFGVPSPHVDVSRASGNLIKFWDTLKELDQISWWTFGVSVSVIVVLIVFEKWIKAIPGGLVAVVGAIAVSYWADLASHGVSTLGPVPSGLPSISFPSGVTWTQAAELVTTAVSMFLVILAQSAATSRAYAVKYQEQFVENDDLVGLSAANVAAGLTGTFIVNGSPTKTEMVDEAKSHTQVAQLTTAVVVAIVLLFLTKPLQYMPNAVLSAVVFLIGIKLVAIGKMRNIWRLRRDEFAVAAITAVVVVVVGVEQGIILAIILSVILHVRRHYAPHDSVVTRNAAGDFELVAPKQGVVFEPGLVIYRFAVGLFYANAERFTEEAMSLVGGPQPPRWFILHADAIDDVDFTGGQTLAEVAHQVAARGITFGVVDASPSLRQELDRFGVTDEIGQDHYYDSLEAAVTAFRAAN